MDPHFLPLMFRVLADATWHMFGSRPKNPKWRFC